MITFSYLLADWQLQDNVSNEIPTSNLEHHSRFISPPAEFQGPQS